MRNVPQEYIDAVRARTRVDRLTGMITLAGGTEVPLSEVNIPNGGVKISKQCITGEELEFGSVILSQLDLAVRTDQSRYVFYNASVTLTYSIQLADQSWYNLPLGVFTVNEADKKNSVVQLTAYDNLQKLDKSYDGTQLIGTPFELLTDISEICGIGFTQTEEEILAFPNGDVGITIDENSGCATYRDCVGVVLQMLTAFAVADASGNLTARRFSTTPVAELTAAHRFTPSISDFVAQYVGVVISSSKGEFSAYDESFESGLEMTMRAAAWNYGTDEALEERTQAVLAELVQLAYTPCTFGMPGDPALECGDMITLPTTDQTVTTLVTSITWVFRGKMNVESAGKNPYLQSIKTRKSQVIKDLEQQAVVNKLIFYSFSNSAAVNVNADEVKPLANVTFVTIEDTSAMFLAQLPLTVEVEDTSEVATLETPQAVTVTDSAGEPASILDASGNPLTLTVNEYLKVTPGTATLEIFYYLDGSLVEYELRDQMHAGPHILGLFYTFADLKGNTSHTWEVRIGCTNGKIVVNHRAVRATITGQGLAAIDAWDGTLFIEQIYRPFSIRMQGLSLANLSEAITTTTQQPTSGNIEQTVPRFSTRVNGVALRGLSEIVAVGSMVLQQTVSFESTPYTYTNESEQIVMQTEYEYTSNEQDIDVGRLFSVKTDTSDKSSTSRIEVKLV